MFNQISRVESCWNDMELCCNIFHVSNKLRELHKPRKYGNAGIFGYVLSGFGKRSLQWDADIWASSMLAVLFWSEFWDLWIFPPFGPEIHNIFWDIPWVDLLYNLFSFPGSFGSGLGLEKCKTRNFSICFFLKSFFIHLNRMMCSPFGFLILNFHWRFRCKSVCLWKDSGRIESLEASESKLAIERRTWNHRRLYVFCPGCFNNFQ